MSLFQIHNHGEIAKLGTGKRTVVALPPGRKWVTLIDWTNLDTATIPIKFWHELRPVPVGRKQGYHATFITRHMRNMLKYRVDKTRAMAEAIALMAKPKSSRKEIDDECAV